MSALPRFVAFLKTPIRVGGVTLRPPGSLAAHLGVLVVLLSVLLACVPCSNRLTRFATIALAMAVVVWLVLVSRHKRALRWVTAAVVGLSLYFFVGPARTFPPGSVLVGDYAHGLGSYRNAPYVWGGEGHLGIDCSGLIRRGFIDSLLERGLATFHPGLVRAAARLWWNDCTARDLAQGKDGLTVPVLETPSLNDLDYSRIAVGDLAVTTSGIHILAYRGNREWIEADPLVGKVITLQVPSTESGWCQTPMKIVRWSVLAR